MADYVTNYRKLPCAERDREIDQWRKWAFESKEKHAEVLRLREIIFGAMFRLTRLADENPEVNHAREILRSVKPEEPQTGTSQATDSAEQAQEVRK